MNPHFLHISSLSLDKGIRHSDWHTTDHGGMHSLHVIANTINVTITMIITTRTSVTIHMI